jgi:hypothetical protein
MNMAIFTTIVRVARALSGDEWLLMAAGDSPPRTAIGPSTACTHTTRWCCASDVAVS